MKRITLLGSTGSIGTQTLSVARMHGYEVPVLAAGRNTALLEEQMREFHPKLIAVADEAAARELRTRTRDLSCRILAGPEGVCEAAAFAESDVVLNAVVGVAGLAPTLAAIAAGKDVALANKETLVAGGTLVMREAARAGVKLLPVDSEHSAIFQCLQAAPAGGKPEKILLTASGGPFYGYTREQLQSVTAAQALKHPTWSMGAKITIDSATMMNKGLEVIEAVHLFGVSPEQIEVVVHRESLLHSAVEFCDGSVIAQIGVHDMRVPIQYALTYPQRLPSPAARLSLAEAAHFSFAPPDYETFQCLAVCREAIRRGGLAPAAANGANEEAVALFLEGKIGFLQIGELVDAAMRAAPDAPPADVEAILAADRAARALVRELLRREG